jgi:hypothetical protein
MARAYVVISAWVVGLILGFVALNLITPPALKVRRVILKRDDNPAFKKYGRDTVMSAYPEMTVDDVDVLLREFWYQRALQYEPFTMVREAEFSGKFRTVTAEGYRVTDPINPWPPDPMRYNIFIFGGSTTHGYGVRDSETIPAHLQAILMPTSPSVSVYNWGRGSYYSTQERILYESLLMRGHVPDVAIFVDGLNEFHYFDGPYGREKWEQLVGRQGGYCAGVLLSYLPVMKVLAKYRRDRNPPPPKPFGAEDADAVIDRYLANRRLIRGASEMYGVKTLCVWQPVPTYRCPAGANPFLPNAKNWGHWRSGIGYERMNVRRRQGDMLWLADMHSELYGVCYVDACHYTGAFSRLIAERIAGAVP